MTRLARSYSPNKSNTNEAPQRSWDKVMNGPISVLEHGVLAPRMRRDSVENLAICEEKCKKSCGVILSLVLALCPYI